MTKQTSFFQTALLVLLLGEAVRAEDLQCPNNLTATSTLRRLKKDIFCSYDRAFRPVRQHNETVDVKIRLRVRNLDFDDEKDILTIHSFFVIFWKDYHLIWNPDKYDKVDTLHIPSYMLWNPDLGVLTSVNEKALSPAVKYTICLVFSNGDVLCVPPVNHMTSCSADLTRWPYDKHKCTMVMSSWTETAETVNVSVLNYGIRLEDYDENREWLLSSTNSYSLVEKHDCCPNVTFPTAIFEFFLERHSGVYATTVILPAVVLMILTLIIFWMDAGKSDRMILGFIVVFFHFIFLQYLGNLLPSNGDKTPLIITFLRDSMLLAITAWLLGVIVGNLRNSSRSLPPWVSSVSSWVLQNKLGQVLIFLNLDPKRAAAVSEASGGEGAALVEDTDDGAPAPGWYTFTTLLDLAGFSVALFVYIILILGFIL